MNRTSQSGSALSGRKFIKRAQRLMSVIALCLSLFLVGSCNERIELFDFSKKPMNVSVLDQGSLVRYAYAVQAAIIQKPQNFKKFRAQDVELALSSPDIARIEGDAKVWQYRTDGCVMDIFWTKSGQQKTVDYIEFRHRRSILDKSAMSAHVQSWECLQTVIQDRRDTIEAGFDKDYAVLSLNAHKS